MTEKLNRTIKALKWALGLYVVVFVGTALSVYAMDSLSLGGDEGVMGIIEKNEERVEEKLELDEKLVEDEQGKLVEQNEEVETGKDEKADKVEEVEKVAEKEEAVKEEPKGEPEKPIEEPKEKPKDDKPDNNEEENKKDKRSGPGSALKVISDGNYLLALVTKETTLKSNYAPSDLVKIPSYMNPPRELYLRAEAFQHLDEMWHDAKAQGINLSVLSTYRSYSYQAQLFADYAAKHGEEAANRFSARPGQSEHQLGTTVDFGGTSADWTTGFANTKQGKWLLNNAHLYGFALSYPEGKESVTGYIYEPWHFRYIGVAVAKEWKESGLVLCEFLKTKPQYFDN